ncbi:MAG: hypothetical protein QOE00_1155 [Ilumatobacteraceae bacterium]
MTHAVSGDGALSAEGAPAEGVGPEVLSARPTGTTRVPGLTIAAMTSIGAGVIHAAAAGVHAEHPQLARLFIVFAVAQVGAGLLALARPNRVMAALLVAVSAAAVIGWLATRVTGISWIDGLEVREAPQFADTACALLAATAVGCALGATMIGRRRSSTPRLAFPAFLVAALTVPAMLSGGTHVHSHTHTASAAAAGGTVAGAAAVDESQPHTHAADGSAVAVVDESQPHTHTTDPAGSTAAAGATATSATAATWPRPWDPTKPIDVSGVAGVTPEQEARAKKLIEDSLKDLPKYADPAAAIADGYASIGDAATGDEHYIKLSLIEDTSFLDATQPESLVYKVNGDARTLAGAMYIASARPTDDPSLLDFAGPLMQWHNHGNLCWAAGPDGKPRVVGITDANGNCANGVNTGGQNPMVHVWITPHPCGVFAALEGVGAGQAAVPDAQRIDLCNQPHTHPAAAVPTKPFDPTQPIDLGGVAGVTPEQQAAAENLVALNVVRLPQWADYRTAEAAGFQSIGDGATGFEHYIKWDSINDAVALDPDHPESLVYQPQPDGSKKLVSAMYFLPDTVALKDVPDIGGALMQWHIHDNLCFTSDPVAPLVRGVTDGNGNCRAPLVKFRPAPMIHVWITPNKCGPFAALEGIGAGQIADGATRLCDTAHGSGF